MTITQYSNYSRWWALTLYYFSSERWKKLCWKMRTFCFSHVDLDGFKRYEFVKTCFGLFKNDSCAWPKIWLHVWIWLYKHPPPNSDIENIQQKLAPTPCLSVFTIKNRASAFVFSSAFFKSMNFSSICFQSLASAPVPCPLIIIVDLNHIQRNKSETTNLRVNYIHFIWNYLLLFHFTGPPWS